MAIWMKGAFGASRISRSVRWGRRNLATKVELKNINSFKFVKDAIEYEIKRQTKVLNEGGKINQETRLWNLDRGETVVMRSKEEAHDYRYFPDPDLVPLRLEKDWIEGCRKHVTELPTARMQRFVSECGLSEYDAGVLTASKAVADYFESCVKLFNTAQDGEQLGDGRAYQRAE